MLPNSRLSFVINNVEEVQSYKQRMKLIQCFLKKIRPTWVLFLQQLSSRVKRTLKVKFFFLMEKNSFGILTTLFGKETFAVKKIANK